MQKDSALWNGAPYGLIFAFPQTLPAFQATEENKNKKRRAN